MRVPPEPPPLPRAPWSGPPDRILSALRVSTGEGLSPTEVRRRLRAFGANALASAPTRSSLEILGAQFASPVVVLLLGAAVLAFAFAETVEAAAILAVLGINGAIGFVTERHAVRSMEALRSLGRARARVRRRGIVKSVAARTLVPGDVLVLEAGDVLAADARLVAGTGLRVDESTLTGESVPVDKDPRDDLATDTPLAERCTMLFKGTALTRGTGEAVVVATGMATELGRITELVAAAGPRSTPLEKRLARLARGLILLTLVVAAAVAVALMVSGREVLVAVEIAVALAVATIPEGLPIVATVALARGMWRMARRNALVQRLAAVETLGSTTVILTDKTGTLTENRMTAVEAALDAGRVSVGGRGLETAGAFALDGRAVPGPAGIPGLLDLVRAGVLCNHAELESGLGDGNVATATGDPTEAALLVLGAKAGLDRTALAARWPCVGETPFDCTTKRMATLHRDADGAVVGAVKGAPEAILRCCTTVRGADGRDRPLDDEARTEWLVTAEEMARRGRRVLAVATARWKQIPPDDRVFETLVLLGLVGMLDPPRTGTRAAIDACQDAGIRVVMVTGDHAATAWAVAHAVGLVDGGAHAPDRSRLVDGRDPLDAAARDRILAAAVFARATPEQKLDLIEAHQQAGAVVAMTGDGVNDAPALESADIGIAMGIRGTQVAREAADMVLMDDDFGTIVAAVALGRAIVTDIRKFVLYLMSCNISEIMVVGAAAVLDGPLPILPLQILFLNLVTDVFPALALGVCEGSPELMRARPRDPRAPMLTGRDWLGLLAHGAVLAGFVLLAWWWAHALPGSTPGRVTTVAFLTLALAQLVHVFNMRSVGSPWLRNEVTTNPWVWAAVAGCAGLLVLAVHTWPLAEVLELEDPGPEGWGLALVCSLGIGIVGQSAAAGREALRRLQARWVSTDIRRWRR